MRPIEEFETVRDGLFFWQGYDPTVKTDLGCCALVVSDTELIFIDPLPLAHEPLEELVGRFRPAGIVLTNANHERAAGDFSRRLGAPVYAHNKSRGEIHADHWLDDGAMIFKNVHVIHLPGFGKGEIALHHGDCVHTGDALINIEPHGLAMLPEKYCSNPKLRRDSLRKLLPLSFELMTFAHGLPIISGARKRLENLLV